MKTKFISVFVALAALGSANLIAGDPVAPANVSPSKTAAAACCAPAPVALASSSASACCAVEAKPVAASCCAELVPEEPLSERSLYQLDATWINDAGESVELASLRGRPVVIAMFFANCGYACPILVNDMQRLRAALPAEVYQETQFVLVSFDVARDTPEVLQGFRQRSGLDAGWTLVRGDTASVQELAMLLGVKFKQEATGQFAHSNLVTVLNAEGEITHQRNGLMGDMSEAAKAVVLAAK